MIKRAIVINNVDPSQMGRIQYRYITQPNNLVPEQDLPWAEPIHAFPGSIDSGSFIIPPLKSIVFIIIEDGDSFNPFYFGCWNNSQGKPLEASSPMKKVLYKSEAGAMVYIDDTQGTERLRVIDRMGQLIEMYSPSKPNTTQRGGGTANEDSAKDLVDALNETTKITLRGLNGVSVELVSKGTETECNIISNGIVNIVGKTISFNGGVAGIHTASNHPYCYYTGQPLNGDPTVKGP